jgi:hypothetical protein
MDKKTLQCCCNETPCLSPNTKDDDLIDPDKELTPIKIGFFKKLFSFLSHKKKK